jgi:hypothetical protein
VVVVVVALSVAAAFAVAPALATVPFALALAAVLSDSIRVDSGCAVTAFLVEARPVVFSDFGSLVTIMRSSSISIY